ncbi:calcium-binding protein [Gloeobacter morelensis]|uniref:Calcium-binding protein n=1 Tax=Gloeobacter morelensis MG652769 TaxID=2781736 RepID=A0ABY3PHC3_9CYAN|nr:hypothetical protein [Gloeobacter morelensis]UFP93076.1 hypothetical protein ISF26_14800 [Gloeobacter morelensis MG652769]
MNAAFGAGEQRPATDSLGLLASSSGPVTEVSLTGTSLNDTLLGSDSADYLYGKDGNDSLVGYAGNDYLYGDKGNDTLNGGDGNDYLSLDDGDDRLDAGLGDDDVRGDAGDDAMIVNYASGTGAISHSFGINSSLLTGNNIENLTLVGNDAVNNLVGAAGNDSLSGAGGNDTLTGVSASATTPSINEIDTLTGGTGVDRFILGDSAKCFYEDGNTGSGGLGDYALITDFNSANGDLIQLNGTSSQYLLGSSPVSGVSGTAVYFDTDGSGAVNSADELIAVVQSTSTVSLSSGFVFVGG